MLKSMPLFQGNQHQLLKPINDLISLGEAVRSPASVHNFNLTENVKVSCYVFLFKLSTHFPLSPPQESADGESSACHEHHPQHLQPDPQISSPTNCTALGQPAGGGSAPQLHCNAAVIQHL